MEVDRCVGGDSVEGQSASRPVHMHSHSVGGGGGVVEVCTDAIVTDGVTVIIGAKKTPGLNVPSKPAALRVSSPLDSAVSHGDIDPFTPLDLPVTATSQTLCTHHLIPVVEPLWLIAARLLLSPMRRLPVAVRQPEVSVCGERVQCEFTGVWWRERDTIQFVISHGSSTNR